MEHYPEIHEVCQSRRIQRFNTKYQWNWLSATLEAPLRPNCTDGKGDVTKTIKGYINIIKKIKELFEQSTIQYHVIL